MSARQPYVAVVGPGEAASEEERAQARTAGRLLAEAGAVLVTGGLGGVMGAAAAGAAGAGGTSVGLLPGSDRADADAAHTLAIPTGLGELRNGLVIRAADAVLCIGGSWGTLSEIALAIRSGVPVVALGGWQLPAPGVEPAESVEAAVARVLDLAAP
jgi:uncharacterized protein (TIGR00725 family)